MTTEHIELRGGKREGAGRPKKLQTQVKDWIKEHPYAVAALMEVLYEKGKADCLEGLKKSMECCDYHKSYESTFGRKGLWVFIPEGKE